MANPSPPDGGMNDDFFEQILSMPYGGGPLTYAAGGGDSSSTVAAAAAAAAVTGASGEFTGSGPSSMFSLGLSLDHHHHLHRQQPKDPTSVGKRIREDVDGDLSRNSSEPPLQEREHQHPVELASLFPPYGHNQLHQFRPHPPHPPVLQGQAIQGTVGVAPHPPAPRPRVRARRGQATDPHSIAERLRRERIAERIRALQELVPNTNKTDRAVMLDEIVDYVKFLRLQVKVLSMSRLGGAGAVAQLVADVPLSSVEGDSSEGRSTQHVWEKWSNDGTERQVAKLMEEDTGAAMQFLQSKSLCIMPISLAATIYPTNPQPESSSVKPEPNSHS